MVKEKGEKVALITDAVDFQEQLEVFVLDTLAPRQL